MNAQTIPAPVATTPPIARTPAGHVAYPADMLPPMVLRSQFAPDSWSYRALAGALTCTHPHRWPSGECGARGCLDGWRALACRCAACARRDGTRPELVNPHSLTDTDDVAAYPGATIGACRKLACYNHGNGRECWSLRDADGNGYLYELPDRATAERIAQAGGRVSGTHRYSFC